MRKTILLCAAATSLLFFAAPSYAGFATTVGGNGSLIAPPSNALADTSLNYHVWNESSGTLASSVTVEASPGDGSFNGTNSFASTTLAAGTEYGTTMIQLNPGVDGIVHSGSATINFSAPIIGLALRGTSLGASDFTGAAGTTYPSSYGSVSDDRGIDFRTNDRFIISNGGLTLEVLFTANFNSLDEFRVFTAGGTAGVPEPASLVVWSVLGAVVAGRAWRRRQRPAI